MKKVNNSNAQAEVNAQATIKEETEMTNNSNINSDAAITNATAQADAAQANAQAQADAAKAAIAAAEAAKENSSSRS